MEVQDFKLYAMNIGAFALSLTELELILKIILLLTTIGYTLYKWNGLYKQNKK
jgi:hypothetical protein